MANHPRIFDLKSLPRSRKEAIDIGSVHFYTGIPCVHGHICPRLTSSKRCMRCNNLFSGINSRKAEYIPLRRKTFKRYAKTLKGKQATKRSSQTRRAVKVNALPAWGDKDVINSFISSCPEGCHIDHIIPLKGSTVCGLHILENLQYLPAQENLRKSNKVIPITLEYAVCPITTSSTME